MLCCVIIDQFPLYGFGVGRNFLDRNLKDRNLKILGKLSAVVAKLSNLHFISTFPRIMWRNSMENWGLEKLDALDLTGNLISYMLPFRLEFEVLNLGYNQVLEGMPSSLSNYMGLQVHYLAGH